MGRELENIDLTIAQRKEIAALLKRHLPDTEVWAYGSRVKFTSTPSSDLDMVAFASSAQKVAVYDLKEAFEESYLPFRVDLFIWDEVPEQFHKNIEAERVVLQKVVEERVVVSEWPRVTISEVCDLVVDCVNKTAPIVEGPTPYKMIRTPNIKNGRVSLEGCRFVEEKTFKKWTRRASVLRSDVLLTREAPLGEVGIVNTDESIFLGQRVMQYRATPTKLDSQFLLYSFLSADLQHQFQLHEGSGSVVSHIRVGDCSKFKLNLPPLSEQKAIAHILGSLDDKIELNRRMNATLEGMAQALFKSWFVDFDPVIDNALAAGNPIPEELAERAEVRRQALADGTANREAAKQFPAAFQLTDEMGWIPDGWEVKKADKIANITIGKTPPRKETLWFSNISLGNVVWVSIRDMGNCGAFIGDSNEYLTPESVDKFNVKVIPEGSVILSFKLTIGRVSITQKEMATNEAIAHFVNPKFELTKEFLYCYLTSFDFSRLGSTSSIATAVNSKIIKGMPFLAPKHTLLEDFKKATQNWFESISNNTNQAQTLTTLRDTLLPKLISGELRIPGSAGVSPA